VTRTRSAAGEIERLQRCINDLVSVLELPASWIGGEPSQIAGTLLDALMGMLRLNLVYVRVNDPAGDPAIEMVQVRDSRRPPPRPQAIGSMLRRALGDDPKRWPSPVRARIGDEDLSLVTLPLGVEGDIGVLVAGCDRAGFPVENESLLLNVAANQAGISLREAWLRREQERVAAELDRRVEQRTADLAAANDELTQSEARLRVIIDTIPALAWSTRPDGSSDYFNERWLSYTGLTAEQSQDYGWRVAVHPDDLAALQDNWRAVLVPGAPGERPVTPGREARLRRYDGEYRWFLFRGSPLQDASGRIVAWYGTNVDIEDRKRAEEALRRSEARLSRAAQTAIAGEFAASVAHEINQPLSGIITNASTCLRMLAASPPNIDGALETARRTIRDGNRASDVITRLRALFRKQGPLTGSVDLNEAAGEVIALLQGELEAGRVVLRTDLAGDLPLVTGDRVQLQQVILNLLRNASDAMRGIDDRPRQVVLKTESDGDGSVRLSVRDAGVGIAPDMVGRVFEAFYTTKDDGMGIGLSVSRSIIDCHQGRLWAAANEDGPGATFAFTIPRTSP
jgi:PAS domain S-box-containing protein